MKKILLILLCSVFVFSPVFSQVGINTESPNSLTALEIENLKNGSQTTYKGIMIPRMTELQRELILQGKTAQDSLSVGSILIYNTDENCYNYYNSIEKEWKSLCGKLGKAEYTVDCNISGYKGEYGTGEDLTPNHYLLLTVIVTKPGSYDITATTMNSTTNSDNGYFFNESGQFLSAGTFTVRVPGYGKPITSTPDYPDPLQGDEVTVMTGIDGETPCIIQIPVKDNSKQPIFSMRCYSTSVDNTGKYVAGTALNANNTISMVLYVNPADANAVGAFYSVYTNEVNGYRFEGNGVLAAGDNNITLKGYGTPVLNGSNLFTIESNATIAEKCEVTVKVATRIMSITSVSDGSGYGWYNITRSDNGMNKLLRNESLFGNSQQAVFPIGGTIVLSNQTDLNFLAESNESNWPDVINILYNFTAFTTTNASYIANYINKGGVVIYTPDYHANNVEALKNICNGIFNNQLPANFNNTGSYSRFGGGKSYPLGGGTMPFIKGPFMDLTGLGIGTDGGDNFAYKLDVMDWLYEEGELVSTAGGLQSDVVFAFAHRTKGFLWIGDGGPFTWQTGDSSTRCPLTLSSGNFPTVNTLNQDGVVYNAHFCCNVLAWAFNHAQRNKK